MTAKRVVISGTGIVSSLGKTPADLFDNMLAGKSGVQRMTDWDQYIGLKSLLGAPAVDYDSKTIPRVARRTMSKMSEMATLATIDALATAGLTDINSPRSVLILGSTTGSPATFEKYFKKFIEKGGPEGQLSTSFFKIMNHSVGSNVAVGLGYNGPQLSIASACSTSTQAVITGWEMISSGLYDVVVAGGADELHHTSAAIFDNVHAASRKFNDNPDASPRPFDADRDGLVVSEGAGVVVLESEEHALARGAEPLAYVDGGAYYCNGTHMTQPQVEGMAETMKMALDRAGMTPNQVDYVNAHGTATLMGDVKEARATYEVLGGDVPVSSIKGHLGHSLAACGAIEVIGCMEMLNHGTLIPSRNLETIDPEAGNINLIKEPLRKKAKVCMSNNFAFGGMNATVIISAV